MPELPRPALRWVGPIAFLNGTGPGDRDNPMVVLAESVEAQTQDILANIDKILMRADLDRRHVVAVRIHLTQFARFEKRAAKAFAGAFDADRGPTVSWVGVDALPRDALIEMDFVVSRESHAP